MKSFKSYLLLGTIPVCIFFACQKSDSSPQITPVPTIEQPDSTVTAGLQGRITDENGAPLKGVQITSGVNTTSTDVNGVFSFASIPLSKLYGYVKAEKSGYFTGSRTILTHKQTANYLEIQLKTRTLKGSFDAAAGATVAIESGSQVVFPASGVMNASTHASYTGTVNVFARYLDPTDPELRKHMPGDLRGTDKDNKNVGLQTYGMIDVELEGSGGEKLQIAEGKTAAIYLPIPASLQASAPDSIPLWYFNDTTGKWIEQGKAGKKDNQYCGNTSHFTYWNCDMPRDLLYFTATIRDEKSNPLANTVLMITETSTWDTRGGYSDASGNVSGWILKNASLSFNILDHCGNSMAIIPEGPFTSDQDLGTLTANSGNTQSVTFSGTVTDCSSAAVTNGFVAITLDGLQYASAVSNGSFSTTIVRCVSAATTATVVAGDYTSGKQSDIKSFDVTGSAINTGEISTCAATFDQYFNFSISGTNYTITSPPDSLQFYPSGIYTYITGNIGLGGTAAYRYINFQTTGTTAGTWPVGFTYVVIGSDNYLNLSTDPLSVTFTTYDPIYTGYVEGTINGNLYKDSTGAALPFTGKFRVKE